MVKPRVERVEEGEQPVVGSGGEAGNLDLEPVPRPSLFAEVEKREHEVGLRGEVAVQRHLRHPRFRDDPVDADGPNPVAAEQLVRGVQDPRPGAALIVAAWP